MITGIVGSSQYVIPASSWSTSTTIGTGTLAPLWNGVDTWIGFDEGQDDMMTASPYPVNFAASSITGWASTTATGPRLAVENGFLFQTSASGIYRSTGPTVAGTQVSSTTNINDLIYFQGNYYAFGDTDWLKSSDGITWTVQTDFTTAAIYGCAVNTADTVMLVGGASGQVWRTTNGTAWTQITTGLGTASVPRVSFANGYFGLGGGSGLTAYSQTGAASTWTVINTGNTGAISLLNFHMGRWVALSSSTETPKVSSSSDPTTMTFSAASATAVGASRGNRKASNNAYLVWTNAGVITYAR